MSSLPRPECPRDETLAAFVEGKVDAATRAAVLAHIERCRDCMATVLSVNAQMHEERHERQPSRSWMAIAAAVLIAAIIAVPLYLRRERGPIARLVALAPRSERAVEPRLSGGFPWAAYSGANRVANEPMDAEHMKLGGAAGELVEQADKDRGAGAQHAAGVALVLMQQPAGAIAHLEAAAKQSNDAKTWSDLAAARYAAASQLGRASLYPTALAAADTALRIDPSLPEALFNRALILERLGLTDEARRAWQRYLDVDSNSPWAAEARAHMAQVPATTHSSQFERDRPLLERAAERGDAAALRRYVDAHRERARAYAEGEYLGHWAEALQRNDAAEAARWLSIARGVGDALVAISGESLLHDAVQAIDSASPADQRTIAAAHMLYRQGRIASSQGQPAAAERDLSRAAELFESVHDAMALQAAFYAASARMAANDTATARTRLEKALTAADLHPQYISYGGFVRWELGRALCYDDDWSGAATVFAEGAAMFRRGGERTSEAFVETMLAMALTSLGRNDDAWLARGQSFAALSTEGDADRLATGIASAVYAELADGHRDAALALSTLQASTSRSGLHPQSAIYALVNSALLESMSGDTARSMQAVREAETLADAIADPQLQGSWKVDVDVARGGALAASNPRAAAESLTRAIDFLTAHNLSAKLPEPLLLRARCAARLGDAESALRDLERGVRIVEEHPAGAAGAVAGLSVLDAEHALFTDAIHLSLERGDNAGAFAFAERLHGTPGTLAGLQQRLAGTGAAVIEIVALPGELVTFGVAENDAVVARHAAVPESIAALADDALSESGTTAAARLYDELIRPANALLAHAGEVVIVAGRGLENVPFAALYDSVRHRYLVEEFAVSTASSAGALQRDEARTAAPALAAVTLPSGGLDSVALPEAENEVREVAGAYGHATAIPAAAATFAQLRAAAAHADVIHIAGHTERQPGGGEQALLFVGASGKLDRVSWKTILASPPANHGVVVLAACETLRPPPSAATRALSLGAAFSAAGARDVIGTLSPIGDRDARGLFGSLHRHLAAGERPAEALRAVQRDAIDKERTSGGSRAWRAVALLTRVLPSSPQRKELLSWAN